MTQAQAQAAAAKKETEALRAEHKRSAVTNRKQARKLSLTNHSNTKRLTQLIYTGNDWTKASLYVAAAIASTVDDENYDYDP